MDTALLIFLALVTAALVAGGIVFCIAPPLSGPVVTYLGLVSYELMPGIDGFSLATYLGWGAVVLVVSVADFFVPLAVTRKFGGTRGAVWGGALGALVGLFIGPFGLVIGPLVGAIVGDLIAGNRLRCALRAGFGTFVGFLLATAVKLAVCVGIGIVIALRGFGDIWQSVTG